MKNEEFYFKNRAEAISNANGNHKPLKKSISGKKDADSLLYIPLYHGEILKHEIKPPQPRLTPKQNKSPYENIVPYWVQTTSSKASFDSSNYMKNDSKYKKNYVDIFYNKIGLMNASGDHSETNRATFDTFSQTKSLEDTYRNDFDAKSFVSDSTSFYLNYIEEDKAARKAKELSLQPTEKTCVDQLKNISQYTSKFDPRISNVKVLKFVKYKPIPNTISNNNLGRLGHPPVAHKEMQNKKQQLHELKTSNQNCEKTMEMKVPKCNESLDLELKKSCKIIKIKKSDLKKYIRSSQV